MSKVPERRDEPERCLFEICYCTEGLLLQNRLFLKPLSSPYSPWTSTLESNGPLTEDMQVGSRKFNSCKKWTAKHSVKAVIDKLLLSSKNQRWFDTTAANKNIFPLKGEPGTVKTYKLSLPGNTAEDRVYRGQWWRRLALHQSSINVKGLFISFRIRVAKEYNANDGSNWCSSAVLSEVAKGRAYLQSTSDLHLRSFNNEARRVQNGECVPKDM